jgi:hypothetical protein
VNSPPASTPYFLTYNIARIGECPLFTIIGIAVGSPLYCALGDSGPSLAAALTYSGFVFAGMVPLWIFNTCAASFVAVATCWC